MFPIQYDLLSATFQRPAEELYDHHHDPYEIRNLADDPRYRIHLERLRTNLNDWMRQTNDPGKNLRNVPRRSNGAALSSMQLQRMPNSNTRTSP